MARPQKQCVDYFPHDNNASEDKIPSILYNHFKHDGISFWWQLQEKVSGAENHIISLKTPTDMEFLAQKLRFMPERMVEILDKCAELGFIDSKLWQERIIWCQSLVDNLSEVYKKRNRPLPIKPSVSVPETMVISPETIVSVTESTQSKVKESKVNKESIINNTLSPETSDNKPKKHTPYQEIVDLYHKLCPSLPRIRTLTNKRKESIKKAYNGNKDPLEFFRELFTSAEDSDFLTGRIPRSVEHKDWVCTIDWMLKEDNITRILEGAHGNRRKSRAQEEADYTGR